MSSKLKKVLIAALCLILVAAIAVTAVLLLGKRSKPASNPTKPQDSTEQVESGDNTTDDTADDEDFEQDDFSDFDEDYEGDDGFDDPIGGTDLDDDFDDFDDFDEGEDFDDEFDDEDWSIEDHNFTNPIQLYGEKKEGTVREIDIEVDNVIHKSFLGFGDHAFVAALNPTTMAGIGYNEAFFEFDMTRHNVMDSNLVRMWFQVDWIVTDTESNPERTDYKNNKDYQNYKKGIYDFDSDAMQSVYRYVERYKEMGTEVMLNFAWKHDERIQTWFSIPSSTPRASAPYDAEAFGNAAAATIKNFYDKGYDNVNFLTAYNEPANGGDFITIGDSWNYAAIVANYTDKALKNLGIRDKVTYMGAENNDHWRNLHTWMDKFVKAEQKYDVLDHYSVHHYFKTPHGDNHYKLLYEDFLYFNNIYGKQMMITEMSASEEDCTDQNDEYFYHRDWNDTYSSYIIAAANVGLKGVLCWGFGGGYTGSASAGWQGEYLYKHTQNLESLEAPAKEFYECGLICNYVDMNSDVLMSSWEGDDIRVSALKSKDGEYTIILDTKGGSEPLDITFNFNGNINKTFYRMQYDRDMAPEMNPQIPAKDKEFAVTRKLDDTVEAKEAMYIYTTKKPRKQVTLNEPTLKLNLGESFDFAATLIDCEAGDEVVWSVTASTGGKGGSVDQNGKYTAPIDANIGDYITVRAQLKDNTQAYATALIEIK